MAKVFEGDEWKYAREDAAVPSRSRADRQSEINAAYALGKINLQEWRTETDRLSEPKRP